ncbi:hypothetical protein [Microbulbifer sp. 2205BS26-8]|nr:hypothetical protein [Microbulbifer sp. 2205BS26-8]MDP5208424.1 hypothetical protein [Microbulbifer sp. 2205BS26-8]
MDAGYCKLVSEKLFLRAFFGGAVGFLVAVSAENKVESLAE